VTGWFGRQPLHRKLIVLALAASSTALLAALVGLTAFDVIRFRSSAADDAHAVAQVIAENMSAAIVFNDADAARQMLASVQVRPFISRACVYGADGTLFASYTRGGHATACPSIPSNEQTWRAVASRVPVVRNDHEFGAVYVERTLEDLSGRVIATTTAGVLMLLLAGAVAFGVARRLQQTISRPIVTLAAVARAIERDQRTEMPPIDAPPDETGALAAAFSDMVRRLVTANEALRLEVDERRRIEAERESLLAREREASRLKDEFLAAVSHELRTPLNAIMGWTQVLVTMKPEERTEEMLAKAFAVLARNAQAQNRVIEDLLDVSRIITGKLQLKLATVDLRAAIESADDVISPIASAKRVNLDVELPPAGSLVHADFDRIRQILWNILSNAVKFTSAGGTVWLRTSANAGTYTIAVSDTGIGIASAFLPHVFERFRQADGSTTREHGGLGLGLALVKELTELHGGTVRATSEGKDRGATFTITLPAMASAGSPVAGDLLPDTISPLRLEGVHVLAIDDNRDALGFVAAALERVGARVRQAASGPEAIAELERMPADLVLCDLGMPGMDGFAVLGWIRDHDRADGRTTPVLAVTAYASADYRERCLRAGFQGHLAKPFATPDLIQAAADALVRV
jgi:signal transduction histidine kinase/CheY-like chemotaxis protein